MTDFTVKDFVDHFPKKVAISSNQAVLAPPKELAAMPSNIAFMTQQVGKIMLIMQSLMDRFQQLPSLLSTLSSHSARGQLRTPLTHPPVTHQPRSLLVEQTSSVLVRGVSQPSALNTSTAVSWSLPHPLPITPATATIHDIFNSNQHIPASHCVIARPTTSPSCVSKCRVSSTIR